MKKVFLVSAAFIMSLYGNMDCPKIAKKSETKEEILATKEFLIDLQKNKEMKDIYFDVLAKYNRTKYIMSYVNKDNLEKLTETQIWGLLMTYKIGEKEKEYKSTIEKVNSFNPGWCKIKNVDANNSEEIAITLQKIIGEEEI